MIKVLLLISESWNDVVHPNNNLTNWFSNFPELEIFTISCGPELPCNHCCKNYFRVCDMDMARSFIPGKRAGKILHYETWPDLLPNDRTSGADEEHSGAAVYLNSGRMHNGFFRLARDFLWRFGRYNNKLLKQFIDDFQPDLVFSQRMGSVKMCRLEHVVSHLTDAPIVAYTGDNEFYTGVQSNDIFESFHRNWTRKWLKKMIPEYKLYYCMSQEQMDSYRNQFGANMKFLVKCGDFDLSRRHLYTNHPIRLVYAGKVYAGRWKTLAVIARVLSEINSSSSQMRLDIYTPDYLTDEQKIALHDGVNIFTHKAVPASELQHIYDSSDIILHVESLEPLDSQSTKYSFSTKIIDCMASGCAVLAVCSREQAGFRYLEDNSIALTASSEEELKLVLTRVCASTMIVADYSHRALSFGRQFHQREEVQKSIFNDFEQVISQK